MELNGNNFSTAALKIISSPNSNPDSGVIDVYPDEKQMSQGYGKEPAWRLSS